VREQLPPALAGERLDRVVAMLTDASRSEAGAWVDDGRVAVNGEPTTTRSLRLSEGDVVEVDVALAAPAQVVGPDPSIEVVVVHEDADLLVVDKPPGLVVHPGAGNPAGTLVHGLLARYPELAGVGDADRPGIVHRLDKDTSGLLVVARTPAAYEGLVADLAAHEVERRYLALAWGTFEVAQGVIDAPIGRSARLRTRMAVSARGRDARTGYEVDAAFRDPIEASLLTCRLETGRTHQIRVHLAAIGHPVVGDDRYRGARQSFEVPRMFLHAAGLQLVHPVTGEELAFESPLPADLAAVLARLS
jgi:23S rRNA pseudouridine1911/1915/1917 synthase